MILAHLPAVSRNPLIALALTSVLLLLQSTADADVYKWVNENNEVQYTQMQPPPGTEFVRIKTDVHPDTIVPQAGAGAAASTGESAAAGQAADDKAMADYEAEVARVSRENCKIANNNLAQLNMGGRLRYRNEAGEYVTMTEEERQKRISEANQQIEMYCKDGTE
jgi:hypothetical protein